MVKDGTAVIDVGINKVDGKLAGDADFESVSKKSRMDNPGSGRCRANDRCDAAGKHAGKVQGHRR